MQTCKPSTNTSRFFTKPIVLIDRLPLLSVSMYLAFTLNFNRGHAFKTSVHIMHMALYWAARRGRWWYQLIYEMDNVSIFR